MANYIIDNFDETTSGSIRPRFAVRRSFLNGYQKFCAAGGRGSYTTWLDVCSQLHVCKAKSEAVDEFSCPHCRHGEMEWKLQLANLEQQAGTRALTAVEKRQQHHLQENIKLLSYHKNLSTQMRLGDQTLLRELQPGQMLCHGDFTSFHPVDEEGSLGVYVLVFRWRESVGGSVFCAVLYCMSSVADVPKDKDFVHSTFRTLYGAGFFEGVTELVHFSDTGTAHFRNSNSLYLFSLFQKDTGIRVRICVYAACHGHNACDSNAGVVKNIVRYQAQELEISGGLWDKEFLRSCMQKQRGASAVEIHIESMPDLVRTIPEILQYHDFSFDQNAIICRKWFGATHPDAWKRVKWELL